jgi:hypothetical protein
MFVLRHQEFYHPIDYLELAVERDELFELGFTKTPGSNKYIVHYVRWAGLRIRKFKPRLTHTPELERQMNRLIKIVDEKRELRLKQEKRDAAIRLQQLKQLLMPSTGSIH